VVSRLVTYVCALIGAALFYILYPFWFSWYLLVLMLMLLPFDLVLSLPGMLTRRVAVAAPKVVGQGEDRMLTATTLQKMPFPARCIRAWMRIYGDGVSVWYRLICGAERGSRTQVEIDTSRSGITVFEITRIWPVSLIGLFSIPASVSCRAATLVLPAPVKPPDIVALPRGVVLRPKPGGGFAEDYDLRHYRPGDPVRSIHWKVSAKFDSIVIREPLVPPSHSRLVHIMKWDEAEQRDLILGRLMWISDYLLKWELPYFVKFGNDGPIMEITETGDLTDYLYRVLDGKARTLRPHPNVPARFTWTFRVDARKSPG